MNTDIALDGGWSIFSRLEEKEDGSLVVLVELLDANRRVVHGAHLNTATLETIEFLCLLGCVVQRGQLSSIGREASDLRHTIERVRERRASELAATARPAGKPKSHRVARPAPRSATVSCATTRARHPRGVQ